MAGIHPGPGLVTLEQPSEQLCHVTCLGSLFLSQPFQYRNVLGQMNTCCVPVREPGSSGLSPHSIWKVESPTLFVLKFYNACGSFNIKCPPKARVPRAWFLAGGGSHYATLTSSGDGEALRRIVTGSVSLRSIFSLYLVPDYPLAVMLASQA